MCLPAAYAAFQENITGSIEAGKKADLVVWSQDFMSAGVESILDSKVLASLVDGILIYGKLS